MRVGRRCVLTGAGRWGEPELRLCDGQRLWGLGAVSIGAPSFGRPRFPAGGFLRSGARLEQRRQQICESQFTEEMKKTGSRERWAPRSTIPKACSQCKRKELCGAGVVWYGAVQAEAQQDAGMLCFSRSIDKRPCSGFQVLHHAAQGRVVQDTTGPLSGWLVR